MFSRIFPFAYLWSNRGLLWQFTLRNVELRHKGSHLGLVWAVLNPLLQLALYLFVFGFIFHGHFGVLPHETSLDYGLGIFAGLCLFHFLSEVLVVAPTLIVTNPNFVKKVVFPLEILPAAAVGASVFHASIGFVLLLIGIPFSSQGIHLDAFWLPVILVPVVLLSLGLSWFLSALGVFLRDVALFMPFFTMVLIYCSGVFFSSAKIAQSPLAWSILRFNPLLLAIELCRDALLWQRPLNFHHLAYLYLCGFVGCSLGFLAFRKMKPAFADVI